MKLFYKVFIRLAVLVTVVLTFWSVFFYYAMMDEVTDEIDDSLEDYTDVIITRSLAGASLPAQDMGSYQLEVSVPTIEKADLREAIFYRIVALYIILLFSFMLINIFVFKRSTKPFFSLIHWLENNRLGDSESAVPDVSTTTLEFQKLNDAIAGYARHSEEVYQQQKQFISNASHEVQTPIAICMSRVEALMEDERLSGEQMEQLAKMHSALEYVARLNKSLLLLSRIDNNQFRECSRIDITSLMQRYLEDYKEVFGYRDIDVKFLEEDKFMACMNSTLAEILVTNLIKNAFVHNVDGGCIEIESGGRYLEIRNTTQGEPLDSVHIFERFYQGKKKEGSTGLGLAIADTICRHSNLVISYNFFENLHCFRIISES